MQGLDETEFELIEEGHGDADRSRYDGSRADDLYEWGVVLPGFDPEIIGDLDITYLAGLPWERVTFSGTLEDLTALRKRIMGEA